MKIAVIGAGSWGTALAHNLALADRSVTLWAREPALAQAIDETHRNEIYAPGIALDSRLAATSDLDRAARADILLIVTPAQHVRATLRRMEGLAGKFVVLCAKGIELDSGKLLSAVVAEEAPESHCAVLTGPTFSSEVLRGLPCAMTLAAPEGGDGQVLADALHNRALRTYLTHDIIGAQIGGAVKNVMAIAAGIVQGRGLGENARAALVTRGIAEMARLAAALGGKRETLLGLSGVGDLLLTATSMQSRNYSLGVELGQGRDLAAILAERRAVTEGVHTARAVMTMAREFHVDMPICAVMRDCLSGALTIDDGIQALLDRAPRREA